MGLATVLLLFVDLGQAYTSNVKLFGTASEATTNDALTAYSGNLYVAGRTGGALNGVSSNSDHGDAYLIKANSAGVAQWTSLAGATRRRNNAEATARGTAFDTSGNAWVTVEVGAGCNPEDSGCGTKEWPNKESWAATITSSSDIGLMKINPSGVLQSVGTPLLGSANRRRGQSQTQAIAVDSSNNVWVAGHTQGNIGIGGDSSRTGKYDCFLLKYNSGGTAQVLTKIVQDSSSEYCYAFGMALDSSGNPWITGYTTGSLEGSSCAGTECVWLGKFANSDGSIIASRFSVFGVSGYEIKGKGITIDTTTDDVWVVGQTQVGFDGQTVTGTNNNAMLLKYNDAGVRQTGSTTLLGCSGGSTKCDNGAIAIDSSTGDIYIGGYTECNLDGNTLTGSRDAFLTKYSSSLVKQCTTLMGVSGQQTETFGAAVLSSGSGKAWFSGKAVGAGGTFGGQTIVGNTRARARPNDDMLPNPEVPDSL